MMKHQIGGFSLFLSQTVTLEDAKKLLDRADAYPLELELHHVEDIRDSVETVEKVIVLLEESKVRSKKKSKESF